jgi:DNA-binding CsgD family transcriptional regulator
MRWLSRHYRSSSFWVITAHTLSRPIAIAADEVVYESLVDLPEDAVVELVTEVLGAPPSATLAEVVAQAGGNPQLIMELVVGLREEGALHPAEGQVATLHAMIPQRVRRGVRHRLNALSPRCRRMLQVAATLGRQLCVTRMVDVMAEPIADLMPLLEEASDAGLITSDGPELAFRNTLLWRAVRASVPIYVHAVLSQEAVCPSGGRSRLDLICVSLSDKERTIAQLAGDGLTNQQIAHRVCLSPHTVNYYLRNIFRKLEVTSRTELAKLLASRD